MLNKVSTSPEFDNEKFESWIRHYSRSFGIEIIFDNNLEHPAGIDTSNLKSPKIYLNMKMIKEKMNFSDIEIFFILFHELEHLKEDLELRKNKEGQEIYKKRNKKVEEKGLSYHTMENILRDIYVNNQVIHPKNTPVLSQTKTDIYKNHLFKENNFLDLPRHLQFIYTFLREEMLDEECIIEDDIRNIINRLKRNNSLEQSINGNLGGRLENIWQKIEPIYERLLEEDKKKQEQQQKQAQEQNGNSSEGDKQNQQQNQESNGEGGDGKDQEEQQEQNGDSGDNQNGEDGDKSSQDQQDGNGKGEGKEKQSQNGGENNAGSNQSGNQESGFEELYEKYDGLPHIIEDNIDKEEFEKKLQEIIDEQIKNEKPKSKEELELEQRVRDMLSGGEYSEEEFEDLKRKLKDYDNFFQKLKEMRDSKTGKNIIDEISKLFEQIKSKRQKPRFSSRGPVDIELGVRLDSASIAGGIAQIKSGNYSPEMFEQDITIEKEKEFVGKFDLTIVADGSGSMKGTKNKEQKKAVLLIFEALKRLNDRLHYEKKNMLQDLEITTKGIIFKGGSSLEVLKEESKLFSDKDRLKLFKGLDYYNGGSTNDYDALEKVYNDFEKKDNKYKKSIKSGKIKKIVFVMTDGESSNENELKNNIQKLRENGVIVYGIGITDGGIAVIKAYKGDDDKLGFGQVCEKAEDLAQTLKDILKEHLEKI